MGDIIYVLTSGVYDDYEIELVDTNLDNIIDKYMYYYNNNISSEIQFWKNGDIICSGYDLYYHRFKFEANKDVIKKDILKHINENNYEDNN